MKQAYGRKLCSVPEFYQILYQGIRTRKYISRARKSGGMDKKFMERIMLAVTHVNQCPLCSYGHARIALEAGMSDEEIRELLAGGTDRVPEGESAAILFAQHYADSRGHPSALSWKRLVEIYGEADAMGILGAVRMIMFGNAFGIVLSSLKGRIKGRPDPRSSLSYEIGLILSFFPLFPAALIHAWVSDRIRLPVLSDSE